MPKDKHAQQHGKEFPGDRDHDQRETAEVRDGLEDEQLTQSTQQRILSQGPERRRVGRKKMQGLEHDRFRRCVLHVGRNSGQAE